MRHSTCTARLERVLWERSDLTSTMMCRGAADPETWRHFRWEGKAFVAVVEEAEDICVIHGLVKVVELMGLWITHAYY